MSLRSKIVYILLVVVALYAAVDNGSLRFVASRFFGAWELEEGDANLERVLDAVADERVALEEKARIWSDWAPIRRFAALAAGTDESRGFIEENLGSRALDSTGVDVLYVCDPNGNVLWGRVLDSETGERLRLSRELPSDSIGLVSPLRHFRGDRVVSGLMMTSHLPLLACSTAISDAEGIALEADDGTTFRRPLYGFVILGRFLDDAMLEKIGAPSKIAIEFERLADAVLNEDEQELVTALTTGEEHIVSRVAEDGRLHLFSSLNDLRTLEPVLVRGVTERDIVALGRTAVDYALLSTLASALLILFVLLRLLQRIVLNPLSSLTEKAIEIGKTDDTTIRTGLDRTDEIGQLSSEFDSMLDKLAESRALVISTARLAGMSEIATGVLHNVGNVLNSVNVSTNLATKNTEQLTVGDLAMMVGVLEENADDIGRFVTEDPRGKHFLSFLSELAESLGKQKRLILSELSELRSGIEHIADLVRSQQTYAGAKGVLEPAVLQDELDAAARICGQALGGLRGVEVVREFEELNRVKIDKHKLMEILVNLIQNAIHALRESGNEKKLLTLRALLMDEHTVRIEVEDNGIGISEENLVRIFHHGFTTKPNGHGFGLHVSANAATEMNASLRVRSDGPGKGTTFFLDIPNRGSELQPAA